MQQHKEGVSGRNECMDNQQKDLLGRVDPILAYGPTHKSPVEFLPRWIEGIYNEK